MSRRTDHDSPGLQNDVSLHAVISHPVQKPIGQPLETAPVLEAENNHGSKTPSPGGSSMFGTETLRTFGAKVLSSVFGSAHVSLSQSAMNVDEPSSPEDLCQLPGSAPPFVTTPASVHPTVGTTCLMRKTSAEDRQEEFFDPSEDSATGCMVDAPMTCSISAESGGSLQPLEAESLHDVCTIKNTCPPLVPGSQEGKSQQYNLGMSNTAHDHTPPSGFCASSDTSASGGSTLDHGSSSLAPVYVPTPDQTSPISAESSSQIHQDCEMKPVEQIASQPLEPSEHIQTNNNVINYSVSENNSTSTFRISNMPASNNNSKNNNRAIINTTNTQSSLCSKPDPQRQPLNSPRDSSTIPLINPSDQSAEVPITEVRQTTSKSATPSTPSETTISESSSSNPPDSEKTPAAGIRPIKTPQPSEPTIRPFGGTVTGPQAAGINQYKVMRQQQSTAQQVSRQVLSASPESAINRLKTSLQPFSKELAKQTDSAASSAAAAPTGLRQWNPETSGAAGRRPKNQARGSTTPIQVVDMLAQGVITGKPTRSRKVSNDDFLPIQVLGKGSYGKVTLVRGKFDDQIYAIKALKKDNIIRRHQVQHTRTERKVLECIKHPFIVELYYAFQNEHRLYFVMEYCPGGELFFHLSRARQFSERKTRFYAVEIVLALEHLHNLDIVYRDLKPENVLLDAEGHVRITDFGLSKQGIQDNTSTRSLCGTPEYLAPEILNQQGHGKAVDWWSLGALIFEMLTGLPPFYHKNRQRLFDNIRHAELEYPPFMSSISKDLLKKLFARDPNERLGGAATDAADIKAHPFFAGVDWELAAQKLIPPPFKPCLTSETDVQYFDKEFLKLPITDSEVVEPILGEQNPDNLFPGFTYDQREQKCVLFNSGANFNDEGSEPR